MGDSNEIRPEFAIVAPVIYENYISADTFYRYHCEALAHAQAVHTNAVWSIARERLADGFLTYPVAQDGRCNPSKCFKVNDGSGIITTLDAYTWWASS